MFKIGDKVKTKESYRCLTIIGKVIKCYHENCVGDEYLVENKCGQSQWIWDENLEYDCEFSIGDRVKSNSYYNCIINSASAFKGVIKDLDYRTNSYGEYHYVATVCTKCGIERVDISLLEHDGPNHLTGNDTVNEVADKIKKIYNEQRLKQDCKILELAEENTRLKNALQCEVEEKMLITKYLKSEINELNNNLNNNLNPNYQECKYQYLVLGIVQGLMIGVLLYVLTGGI